MGSKNRLKQPALVKRTKICSGKKFDRLGLKDALLWNHGACIGNQVWAIASKAYHLWVIWTNEVYLKAERAELLGSYPSSTLQLALDNLDMIYVSF